MTEASPLDTQFFPTPRALAIRMWKKFKSREVTRCLEPSCGNADLLLACKEHQGIGAGERLIDNAQRVFSEAVDACEIDMSKHARLRELGINIVGIDFLQFTNGAAYSHIILNPPFLHGVKHVLHAWDILWDGEIVALVNAETVRNPFSAERQLLVRLIELHGEVEYISDAFTTDEAARKTEVECALIYLRKKAEPSDLLDNLLNGMKADCTGAEQMASGYETFQELALPNSVVENQVLIFNASVKAWKEAILAEGRAIQRSRMIGATMAESDQQHPHIGDLKDDSANSVRRRMNDKYSELKDRAWTSILRGSQVTSKLSLAAQKRVMADFEKIKALEFTVENIHGFLLGIAEGAGEIQVSMMLDVFDNIVRYHSDNAVFYRGWKSNDEQRRCGMRVKMRRFILPNFGISCRTPSWENLRRLEDFDRVFALLDGKEKPEVSLVSLFHNSLDDIKSAKRVSSTYFDIRLYNGIGTIHFFPRRADLMDRLNLVVGQHRSWLPHEPVDQSKDFWQQYAQAESFDRELRDEVAKDGSDRHYFGYGGALGVLTRKPDQVSSGYDRESLDRANGIVDRIAAQVQLAHGINADNILEFDRDPLLLLAA